MRKLPKYSAQRKVASAKSKLKITLSSLSTLHFPLSTHSRPGIVMILVFIFLGVVLILSASLFQKTQYGVRFGQRSVEQDQVLNVADAGIDYALWNVIQTPGWSGNNPINIGSGSFATQVTGTSTKNVKVTAYVPSQNNPRATQTVSVDLEPVPIYMSFKYALASLTGNIQLGGNVTENSDQAVDPADIWSGNSINTISGSNTVDGKCSYDNSITNVTCDNGYENTVGGPPNPNYDEIFDAVNNCTFYQYWEARAYGDSVGTCQSSDPTGPRIFNCPANLCEVNSTNPWNAPPFNCAPSSTPVIGSVQCDIGPYKIVGTVNFSFPNPAHIHIRGTVYIDGIDGLTGNMTLSGQSQLVLGATGGNGPVEQKGTVLMTAGKITLESTPYSGSCVDKQEGSAANAYLSLVSKSTNTTEAIKFNCTVDGTLTAANSHIKFSRLGGCGTLYGAALAKSITVTGTGCANNPVVYDYSLQTNCPECDGSGGTPSTWQLKKGTFAYLDDDQAISPLVGHWKFSDNLNDSTFTNDGISDTLPYNYPTGKVGKAIELPYNKFFHINHASALMPIKGLTVSLWYYATTTFYCEASYPLIKKDLGYKLHLTNDTNCKFVFEVADPQSNWYPVTSNTSIPILTGGWYHVAGTYKENQICIYVNGSLDGTCQEAPSSLNASNQPIDIGPSTNAPTGGYIDDLCIFNRELKLEEIQSIYNNGNNGTSYCDQIK